jgi:hypothetical protein
MDQLAGRQQGLKESSDENRQRRTFAHSFLKRRAAVSRRAPTGR